MMQQQTGAATGAPPLGRDPQSFTRGDVRAWKVVAYTLSGFTVVGTAAAIIVFTSLAA